MYSVASSIHPQGEQDYEAYIRRLIEKDRLKNPDCLKQTEAELELLALNKEEEKELVNDYW